MPGESNKSLLAGDEGYERHMCNMTITSWSALTYTACTSGPKNTGQDDSEDDEEDSQTDGDPNLLLHWNKKHFRCTQASTFAETESNVLLRDQLKKIEKN